jgi:hypothetical protein
MRGGGRHRGPDDDRPTGIERVLRHTWMAAVFLALLVGVFVVPLQFIDTRDATMAQQIDRSNAVPYPVLEVRQKVERFRFSYVVDVEVATYRRGAEVVTARLHGYDSSAVVAEREGWFVVPERGGAREVYVTEDGRTGFLADDYRLVLDGEFDDVYVLADLWIGGWALVGLGALTWLTVQRARRGVTTARQIAVVPALYCTGAAGLVALGYGSSFPLAG